MRRRIEYKTDERSGTVSTMVRASNLPGPGDVFFPQQRRPGLLRAPQTLSGLQSKGGQLLYMLRTYPAISDRQEHTVSCQ